MNSAFLDYFTKELTYLREAGAEFATAHPKVAGRLKLNTHGSQDPQIALLMEAFAFLSARVHMKLADDFPELTQTLLNILYPHYQAPIPAMSIAQLQPNIDLANSFRIPAGTLVESDPALGEICHFQTCYDTLLLPVSIETAEWMDHLQFAPNSTKTANAAGCIRLVLRCSDPEMSFAKLMPQQLRLFLNGSNHHMFMLYERLLKNTTSIALARNYKDANTIWLNADKLKPTGFNANEGLLPYSTQSLLAYRLLTEYFIFPEKFLFIDLALADVDFSTFTNHIEIFIYLNCQDHNLTHVINKNVFALGCTPIINLFKRNAEPIYLNHQHYEYPIIADSRRVNALEIYSVDKVMGVDQQGNEIEYLPFSGMQYGTHTLSHPTFWSTTRRSVNYNQTDTDIFLSLTNNDFDPTKGDSQALYLETTCMNRIIPDALAYSNTANTLQLSTFTAPITGIRLLTPLTPRQAPLAQHNKYNALLSHLTLNQASLVDEQNGVENLRQILRLYNFSKSDESSALAESLINLTCERIVRRRSLGVVGTFSQGLKITIELDDTQFVGNSAYLFASVLEHFLALYCGINSFVQLCVLSKQNKRIIYEGLPANGEKYIL